MQMSHEENEKLQPLDQDTPEIKMKIMAIRSHMLKKLGCDHLGCYHVRHGRCHTHG